MRFPTTLRSRLAWGLTVGVLIAVFLSFSSSRVLRGSLIDDRVVSLADTDHNGTLSISEMRKVIVHMIQAMITHDAAYDLNLDSITHSDDLTILIQSIRDYLSAECGNGIVQAGEQCDRGSDNGQTCTAAPGESCTYCSSVCKNVIAVTPAPSCLLDGLTAYWKLDEGSGKRFPSNAGAYSLQENYGEIGSTLGKIGQAAYKNTVNGQLLSDGDVLHVDQSFSIAEWVKVSSLGDTGTKYLTHVPNVWYLARNKTQFFTGIGYSCPNCSLVVANGIGTIKVNQWYFIVTAFDHEKNTISISVNGGSPQTASAGLGPRSVLDMLGSAFKLTATDGYVGDIFDEIGVWNRVLSAQEISSLYGNGAALDFGSFQSCTASVHSSAPSAVCGNNIVELGEQCDDGNNEEADGCRNNCTFRVCGDGVRTTGEACDDGNRINDDACNNNCVPTYCGDTIIQSSRGEECDDGNSIDGDNCTNACKKPVCGDQIIWQGHEQCDDNPGYGNAFCNPDCTKPVCGNSVKEGIEGCDDGDMINDNACTNACHVPRCGDHIVQSDEQCDEGSPYDSVTCSNRCRIPVCGNGILERAREQCDDGNSGNGDGCTQTCSLEPSYACTEEQPNRCYLCGNTVKEPGEACDDGNTVDTDLCSNVCDLNPFCGDGLRGGTEQCDDRNGINGDGCSSLCTLESPGNSAELSVTGTAVRRGDNPIFGISVYNNGPAAATYTVSMTVPSGWTLDTANSTPGGTLSGGVFTYEDTESRAPGTSMTTWAAFHAPGGCGGVLLRVASSFYDFDTSNNASEAYCF